MVAPVWNARASHAGCQTRMPSEERAGGAGRSAAAQKSRATTAGMRRGRERVSQATYDRSEDARLVPLQLECDLCSALAMGLTGSASRIAEAACHVIVPSLKRGLELRLAVIGLGRVRRVVRIACACARIGMRKRAHV